jgi:hypothetical protein
MRSLRAHEALFRENRIAKSPGFRYDVYAGWSSLVARWAHNPSNFCTALSPHTLSFTVFSRLLPCFAHSVRQLLHKSGRVKLKVALARPSQFPSAQSLNNRFPEQPSPLRSRSTKLWRRTSNFRKILAYVALNMAKEAGEAPVHYIAHFGCLGGPGKGAKARGPFP